jgi:hypothetical protein
LLSVVIITRETNPKKKIENVDPLFFLLISSRRRQHFFQLITLRIGSLHHSLPVMTHFAFCNNNPTEISGVEQMTSTLGKTLKFIKWQPELNLVHI